MEQHYTMLANMSDLKKFGLPILAGLSRKSMAFKLLGITPEEALNATTVMNTIALERGADWLRVHDVLEAAEAVKIVNAVKENK
ncbi:MAG: Dihydropteroate synthase [Bacteroidetes bacterium ADurb.BinA104]|nr:MAG: Dihydropteroate synthase [Bacteroidetes bacterium ADurb.BinA104]